MHTIMYFVSLKGTLIGMARNSTIRITMQTYPRLSTCTAFFMNDTQCQKATEIFFVKIDPEKARY